MPLVEAGGVMGKRPRHPQYSADLCALGCAGFVFFKGGILGTLGHRHQGTTDHILSGFLELSMYTLSESSSDLYELTSNMI
jgi:hypothetical protein